MRLVAEGLRPDPAEGAYDAPLNQNSHLERDTHPLYYNLLDAALSASLFLALCCLDTMPLASLLYVSAYDNLCSEKNIS